MAANGRRTLGVYPSSAGGSGRATASNRQLQPLNTAAQPPALASVAVRFRRGFPVRETASGAVCRKTPPHLRGAACSRDGVDSSERGMYRCAALSLPGFVQQLAVSYVANGYVFYVVGTVPERKDAQVVDAKLIARYGIDCSKFVRARRKAAGKANLHYLRYLRTFVLLATHGEHEFFVEEAGQIRDVRREPLKVEGYSIAVRGGRVSVRIERSEYLGLKAYFRGLAVRRPAAAIADELASLPYEPYAPIRRQMLGLLGAVNRARRLAGLDDVPLSCLRLKRHIVPVFTQPREWKDRGDGRPKPTAAG